MQVKNCWSNVRELPVIGVRSISFTGNPFYLCIVIPRESLLFAVVLWVNNAPFQSLAGRITRTNIGHVTQLYPVMRDRMANHHLVLDDSL